MDELQQAIADLKAHRDTLPEGAERDDLDSEIAEAESLLAELGGDDADMIAPPTVDEDLEAEAERLREQGFDVDGDEPKTPDPVTAPDQAATDAQRTAEASARKYASEQQARISRVAVQDAERRVDALISGGAIAPAEREMVVGMALRLGGHSAPASGGVRFYAEGEAGNQQAADDLFTLLGRTPLGTLRAYTQHAERSAAPASLRINAPEHAQVNDASAQLAARIKTYADQNGIKDFGEAAIRMEAELGRDAVLNP